MDKAGQLAGVEIEYAFDFVPILGRDRVAGDHQHIVYPFHGQAQKQSLGSIQIAVTAGHMGQRLYTNIPLDFTGQQAAVRPWATDGTICDRHRIGPRAPQGLHPLPKARAVVIYGWVQFHGNDTLTRLQLLPKGVGRIGRRFEQLFRSRNGALRKRLFQSLRRLGNMFRRSTAAAAYDGGASLNDLCNLPCKVVRLTAEYRAAAQHGGVTGVGHDSQRLIAQLQGLNVFQQMAGARNTVKAHCIHPSQFRCKAIQLAAQTSGAGHPTMVHGKGNHKKRIRIFFLQPTSQFREPLVTRQRFHQKMGHPLFQKPLRLRLV